MKRVEDPRFITGAGTYLSDIRVDGALWMVVVRSIVPRGEIGEHHQAIVELMGTYLNGGHPFPERTHL